MGLVPCCQAQLHHFSSNARHVAPRPPAQNFSPPARRPYLGPVLEQVAAAAAVQRAQLRALPRPEELQVAPQHAGELVVWAEPPARGGTVWHKLQSTSRRRAGGAARSAPGTEARPCRREAGDRRSRRMEAGSCRCSLGRVLAAPGRAPGEHQSHGRRGGDAQHHRAVHHNVPGPKLQRVQQYALLCGREHCAPEAGSPGADGARGDTAPEWQPHRQGRSIDRDRRSFGSVVGLRCQLEAEEHSMPQQHFGSVRHGAPNDKGCPPLLFSALLIVISCSYCLISSLRAAM